MNGRNGRNGIVSAGESQATCLPLDNYNVVGCLRRSKCRDKDREGACGWASLRPVNVVWDRKGWRCLSCSQHRITVTVVVKFHKHTHVTCQSLAIDAHEGPALDSITTLSQRGCILGQNHSDTIILVRYISQNGQEADRGNAKCECHSQPRCCTAIELPLPSQRLSAVHCSSYPGYTS